MKYLNWRGPQGLETIDHSDDSAGYNAGTKERRRIARAYAEAGMPGAYWSSRPCKEWNQ